MRLIRLTSFIIVLLLFIAPTLTAKVKNQNITSAEQLIKDRQFKEAKELLLEELENDSTYEDYIMKLLKTIDKEIAVIQSRLEAGMKLLQERKYADAEAMFRSIDANGDYGRIFNDMIRQAQALKDEAAQKVDFNNFMVEGEKLITAYRLEEAYSIYSRAINIYRVGDMTADDESDITRLTTLIERFNNLEREINELKFTPELNDKSSVDNFDQLQAGYNGLKADMRELQTVEAELIRLNADFTAVKELYKKRLDYQAYSSITQKYLTLLRRKIQHDFKSYTGALYSYTDGMIKSGDETADAELALIYTSLLKSDLTGEAFYKQTVDFNNPLTGERSRKNIYDYTAFVIRRYGVLLSIDSGRQKITYVKTDDIFDDYLDEKEKGQLLNAEKLLLKADKSSRSQVAELEGENSIEKRLPSLSSNKLLAGEYKEYAKVKSDVYALAKKIEREKSKLTNINNRIKYNLNEADIYFKEGTRHYKVRNYTKARSDYEKSKEKYLEVLADTESEHASSQIKIIDKRLAEIEQVMYEKDLEDADNYLENARRYLYAEEYIKARNEINAAKIIYQRYDVKNQLLDYYDERITTALKIRSGTQLIIGDPLYGKITELYTNAERYYNKKNYKKATEYVEQILREKPYYKKARILEVKLLRIVSPEAFAAQFRRYYDEARNKFKAAKYTDALLEFNQLLEFNPEPATLKEINKFIYDCKLKLGIIKPQLAPIDKNAAVALVTKANQSYTAGKYEQALKYIEEALTIWPEVPNGPQIRLRLIKVLKKPSPKLSTAEERLYKKAELAYSEGDFEDSFNRTKGILDNAPNKGTGAQYDKVRALNKRSKLKMSN